MTDVYRVTESDGSTRDILANEAFVNQYYPGRWVLIGPEPIPPEPTLPPVITKVAFISRFTPQEYVGVVAATKTDVEVQAWYDLFQAANVVDLTDQRTVAGVNSFVAKNLLTQDRADAILNDPVQKNETP